MKSTAFIDFVSVLVFVIKGDAGSPGPKGMKGSSGPPVCQQSTFCFLIHINSEVLTKRVPSSTAGSHGFAWCHRFTRIGRSQGDCFAFPISQQPQQFKKDKRGFLKMAKTLLETERRFEPPSYLWGCSSNYDPGKSIQQINLRQQVCPSVVEVWWILFLGILYLSKTHWNTSYALTSTSKSSTHWSCQWNFSGNVLCPVWGRVCVLPRVHYLILPLKLNWWNGRRVKN